MPPRRRLTGAWLVLVLLAGYLAVVLIPHESAALRLAGLSLLWWYGGIVAPVLGAVGVVALWRHQGGEGRGSGGEGRTTEAQGRPADTGA